MKKAIIYIGIFITFILIYILHSNLFTWFNIAGVQPNMFVILILFCGLFTGKISGMVCGVIVGIFLDLFIQVNVLIEPIMLGIIGFVSGVLAKNFSKENRFNIMIMVILTTLAYELGVYILRILIYGIDIELVSFFKIIVIECLYNSMITIILYPLIQFFGQKIEEKLFGNKVLRYF